MDEKKNVVKAKVVFVSWNSAQKDIKNQICEYLNKNLTAESGGPSLSFEDKEAVAKRNNFNEADLEVCFDSDKNCYGDITEACKNGVMLSTVFLVICSDTAVNSKWVMFEIDCAKNSLSRNYIVPVYLTELLSGESNKMVQSLASGITVEHLVQLINGGKSSVGLSEADLKTVFNKVQVALNEHIYSDYLLSQIKSLDSTVIKDYEGDGTDAYDFKSLYVGRNIYKVEKSGAVDGATNFSESMLVEQSDAAPIIVYGKAGSGKSMLINKIVYDIYENISSGLGEEGAAETPLVFKVPLKELGGKTLTGYLYEKFTSAGRYGNYTEDNFKDLLSLRNRDGGIRIFFDAIDEVISLGERQAVIEKINAFCAAYNNCKLVFTARGNDGEFVLNATKNLNLGCRSFHLEQFSGEQSAEYINNVFSQLSGSGKLKAGRSSGEFSAAIADINGQIKSNPFILTQLIFIYNDGGADKLPKTLAPIYEKAMRYYIRREKEATLNENVFAYEKILARAAYFKFMQPEKNFRALFGEMGENDPAALKAYDYFAARSVINSNAFFYQIFNDYYAAKYIFTQTFKLNIGMRYELSSEEILTALKVNIAAGKKWSDVCRIFLSMVEDKCSEGLFAQVLASLAADEGNLDLLLDISSTVLSKYKFTAEYILINRVFQRTARGGYGWYDQLCYYVPVYGLYAPFAQSVANYNGDEKRKALCVLRDVCFIYGAFDGVEDIEGIPGRAVDELKSAFRAEYEGEIKSLKKGKLRDGRAALNIVFYLGVSFEGEEDAKPNASVGGTKAKYALFEGERYAVKKLLKRFSPVYPREFCVMHAINRRSEAELDRPKKQLFEDSEGLFTPCDFGEREHIGLRFTRYDRQEITANFADGRAARLTGLILLPSEDIAFEYVEFNKRNLFYYSFPDNIAVLKTYCFNFCRNISYLFISGDVVKIEEKCFGSIQKLYLYLESSEQWGAIDETDNLKASIYKLKGTSLLAIGDNAFYWDYNESFNLTLKSLPKNIINIGDKAFYHCEYLALTSLPDYVTEIGENAFYYCDSLALTSLPTGLTEIKGHAFEGCVSLALTSLPQNITKIDFGAFKGCKLLSLTSLPEGVKKINSFTFEGCTSLALTSLPKDLTEIGDWAFKGCALLALRDLPEDITKIGSGAFEDCASLALTSLPKNLTEIEFVAFENCSSLALESLPNGITKIRERAFSGCASLALTSLPEGVKDIDSEAFKNCSALALKKLPDNLYSIRNETFYGCSSLALEALPSSLYKIDDGAFYGCANLKLKNLSGKIEVIADNAFEGCSEDICNLVADWRIPKLVTLDFDGVSELSSRDLDKQLKKYNANKKDIYKINIADSVCKVDEFVFENCISLTSAKLPEGLKNIERHLFFNCPSLVSVNMPNGVEKIGDAAFYKCLSLNLACLPENLKEIGDFAFYNCTSLAPECLPEGLVEIGQYAFSSCNSLKLTALPDSIKKIGGSAFGKCTSLALTSLPKDLVEIGFSAFSGCTSLALTSLPDGLSKIGIWAFNGCTSLALTSLPEGMKEIDDQLFSGCKLLALTSLPKGLKKIGYDAFSYCTSLTLTNLPEDLVEVDSGAFLECTSLALTSLPDGWTTIKSFVFCGCTSLALKKLPEKLTEVCVGAFSGCTSLALESLPERLEKIEDGAFGDCASIVISKIPEKVVEIGGGAFRGCTAITEMYIPKGVMEIGDKAFEGCSLKKLTLPKNFENDINRIFGDIDKNIITFI